VKIAIVANGRLTVGAFYREILKKADMVVCADGGANHCQEMGITPHAVVGDMDSISGSLLRELQENSKTDVVVDNDQDYTDLQLAIRYAKAENPDKMQVLCSVGDQLDHTLANIMCLEPGIELVDPCNRAYIVDKEISLKGRRGSIVSVIALSDVCGLSYQGLKWGVRGLDVPAGWLGIRNRMTGNEATVRLNKGRLLVIVPC
jgi:thiamine pyrophosphokinase